MQLPFLTKSPKPANVTDRQYFFALQIAHNSVTSAIWSIINDHPQVLSVGTSATWDDQSDSSLVTAADESLSDASNHLDPTGKIQPTQVILGLPSDWVASDKISTDKLAVLKNLSTKLDLKPVGFVTTHEAIIRYLRETEGVPPTLILLGFWSQYLELVLVRLGKTDVPHLIKRSSQVQDDVVEGLSRYPHVDMLPSRMLLYDSGLDLEQIKQTLLAQPWLSPQKKLPFLHFPKIELLPADFAIRAVALSGGSEVAHALGLLPDIPDHTPPSPVSPNYPPASSAPATPSDLGFSEEGELLPPTQMAPLPAEEPTEVYIPLSQPTRSRFQRPTWSIPKLPAAGLLILPILLIIAGALFAAYWFLPTSQVTIFVTPLPLTHQFDLTARVGTSQVDTSNLILPAFLSETQVSGKKSMATTGSKTIGDKATGSVTIYNGTDVQRKFTSGTTISSPSGLKFVLDADVTVASASGAVPNIQYGKSSVAAVAGSIGSQYNLTSATVFKIGTFSEKDISAQNDAAFSGGSTQQVRAVAKSDIIALRSALTKELQTKSLEKLHSELPQDKKLIDESVTSSTLSESFDYKEGDVADNVELALDIKATAISTNNSALSELVTSQVTPKIPDGYSLSDSFTPSFALKSVATGSAVLTAAISADLLPKLDTADIATKITGKFPQAASDYLKSLLGVAGVDFLISPPLPSQISTLPHVPSHIHITIQPQK